MVITTIEPRTAKPGKGVVAVVVALMVLATSLWATAFGETSERRLRLIVRVR